MHEDRLLVRKLNRRSFVFGTSTVTVGALLLGDRWFSPAYVRAAGKSLPEQVTLVEYSENGRRQGMITVPTISKADASWRQQLSPEAFKVTRQQGTERAYTGAYWNLHDKGLYRCICCDTALFNSATKFYSGTGWPSFWEPVAKENVLQVSDSSFGMERTAVSCQRCKAHLGHVFDDGPQPTGFRYCMNSVSLIFKKMV